MLSTIPAALAALLVLALHPAPHLAFHHFASTSDLPAGAVCGASGTASRRCASPLVCELYTLPSAATSFSSEGRCRLHATAPAPCSLSHCTTLGARAACTLSPMITTCGAWAVSVSRPICPTCPEADAQCDTRPFMLSSGARFCTECALRAASCAVGFRAFGPASPGGCFPAMPLARPGCCRRFGSGCALELDACRVAVEGRPELTERDVPCRPGLVCAAGAIPRRNESTPLYGRCRPAEEATRWCTVFECALRGDHGVCSMAPGVGGDGQRVYGTCAAWAWRKDGGDRPDCSFECEKGCVMPKENRPVGSDSYRYCSQCWLRKRSCESGFVVHARKQWGVVLGDNLRGCVPGEDC